MQTFPTGEGTWLRCQFHAHTTNSDGDATPAAFCDDGNRAWSNAWRFPAKDVG